MSFTLNILYMLKWLDASDKPWLCLIMLPYLIAVTGGVLRMFRKAGMPAWHAMIPVYGTYRMFSIAWRGWPGIVYRALSILTFILMPDSMHLFVEGPRGIVCFLCLVACLILSLIMKAKMARSFGHGPMFCYAMIFAGGICSMILGYGSSEYLGPTLVRPDPEKRKAVARVISSAKAAKRYMIRLYRWRSVTALIACVVTLACSLLAIYWGITSYMEKGMNALHLFCYFTILSNCITALASGFVIPYAVDGINRKRFAYPRWITMLHYSGTICTTLTMTFAVFIISWFNADFAFGRYNFFLHLICPTAVLIAFFVLESNYLYTLQDSFICMTPFYIYTVLYVINVVFIGKENGGWEDLYYMATFVPVTVSLPIMYFMAIAVATLIRITDNRISIMRQKKLTASWGPDAEPVEVKIEAFGLGRYDGKHGETNSINIPLEILDAMSEKYSIPRDELFRAYMQGVTGGLDEREAFIRERQRWLVNMFGKPEKGNAETESEGIR